MTRELRGDLFKARRHAHLDIDSVEREGEYGRPRVGVGARCHIDWNDV
jgi:hypothetical protein